MAAVVGLATLRVSGVYFVIFSLGLAELVRQFMTWLQHVLGTMSGLYVTIDRSEPMYYWQLLLLTAVVFLVGWWIGRSRLGFALRIIGNDELVAVHCGINTARAKVVLFVISSTFAVGRRRAGRAALGLRRAGRRLQSVPVVPGRDHGAARRHAPAVGTARRRHSLRAHVGADLDLFPDQTTLLLGVCFLLIVYVIPNGITGLIEDAWHGRKRMRADRPRRVAAAARRLDRLGEEPAATAEKQQCLALPRRRSSDRRRRHQALRRPRRGREHVVQACREGSPGPDRAERLRQDHDDELDLRRAQAELRRDQALRRPHYRASAPATSPEKAWPAPSSWCACCRR